MNLARTLGCNNSNIKRIGGDLVPADIGGDDFHRKAALRGQFLIGHQVRPSHSFDPPARQPLAEMARRQMTSEHAQDNSRENRQSGTTIS
jgi:hypothetical protein